MQDYVKGMYVRFLFLSRNSTNQSIKTLKAGKKEAVKNALLSVIGIQTIYCS